MDSRNAIKSIKTKILIIGIAYKPDVNDMRESPSIKIFKRLMGRNNIVDFHDTKIKEFKINQQDY